MELESTQESLLPAYLASFDHLIGDARTGVTFGEIVKGIIGAGSRVCQQIAGSSVILSEAKDGARRVRRMVKGKSTKRSEIDAETATAAPRERGITHLSEVDEEELWLIADMSELRKPDLSETHLRNRLLKALRVSSLRIGGAICCTTSVCLMLVWSPRNHPDQ
jgi:hypothetical protein